MDKANETEHLCGYCELPVRQPRTALFNGTYWFCDVICHGRWCSRRAAQAARSN